MDDLVVPDMVWGGLALTLAILYAAWHEHRGGNPRDARLLSALGAVGLMGSAIASLQ